jgi:hypothetical protein
MMIFIDDDVEEKDEEEKEDARAAHLGVTGQSITPAILQLSQPVPIPSDPCSSGFLSPPNRPNKFILVAAQRCKSSGMKSRASV